MLKGDSIDKKVDFGINFTKLFESFINSNESNNMNMYRNLLCIMNKMLFYDGEHIQKLFSEIIYDNHFFKNLNGELNYYIIQYISSSKKYELCQICSEITDITKLTIQFFQLLGEGFNTSFHENILEKINTKNEKKNLRKIDIIFQKADEFADDDIYQNDKNLIINEEMIAKSIKLSVMQEMNLIKEKPHFEPKLSIYESMFKNLKTIFYLMELKSPIEGEMAFDKLCILSNNIIDFLIEYIDTTHTLINIIDTNIKNLFLEINLN